MLTRIENEEARRAHEPLRALLDRIGHHFEKGGRLERFHPLWEAADTFLYTPASVTKGGAHVRDALDLKRMMMLVVIAALPCVYMALYNTGLQANLALDPGEGGVARRLAPRRASAGSASATRRTASSPASSTARSTSCRSTS